MPIFLTMWLWELPWTVLTAIAFEVLDYALLSAPGAPLKKALLDAGIGKDIYGAYEDGIRQPYFDIIAKGANADKKEEFVSIIRQMFFRTVAEQELTARHWMPESTSMEFRYREADFCFLSEGPDLWTGYSWKLAV